MPTIHVLLTHQELDPARLAGKVVVVLDVLFATTTIVHALAEGVSGFHPVRSRDEGVQRAGTMLDRSWVMAGEYLAMPIEDFAPATPLALMAAGIKGSEVVYCTSNGTQALVAAAPAAAVYVGALLNGHALATHLAQEHARDTLLIVCSGSLGRFSLEDFHGAGQLIDHLIGMGDYALTDSARAALHAFRGCDTPSALRGSRVGRMMLANDLCDELELAGRTDSVTIVPTLTDGRLTQVAA